MLTVSALGMNDKTTNNTPSKMVRKIYLNLCLILPVALLNFVGSYDPFVFVQSAISTTLRAHMASGLFFTQS